MTETAVGPAYRIETERLILRCWDPADAQLVRTVIDASDEHLRRWIPFMTDEPRSLLDTAKRIRMLRANFDQDEEYRYAIFDRATATLHGGVGLFRRVGPGALEVGYWIGVESVRRGFATEAAGAVVRVAFEVERCERVEMHNATENKDSARVPEKLGFVHEGTLRRRGIDGNGDPYDLMIWTMFDDMYPDSPASRVPTSAFNCVGQLLL